MDTRKKHSNTIIHENIRGIETDAQAYIMVLLMCIYEFDADKLEQDQSSLIDIIFSGGFSYYHKYEVNILLSYHETAYMDIMLQAHGAKNKTLVGVIVFVETLVIY